MYVFVKRCKIMAFANCGQSQACGILHTLFMVCLQRFKVA